jgi:taurine transport system ATP-binding protein
VLSSRPGRIVLDRDIDLPRTGIEPGDLRGLVDYTSYRTDIGHAVRSERSTV